jgi:hypothetical protein
MHFILFILLGNAANKQHVKYKNRRIGASNMDYKKLKQSGKESRLLPLDIDEYNKFKLSHPSVFAFILSMTSQFF